MSTRQQNLGGGGPRPPWARLLFLRSVQVVAGFWVLATIAVFLIVGDGELPFGERPSLEGVSLAGEVINGWANPGIALILIGVTFLITRGRAVPNMAARAPEKTVALAETAALVGYGVLVQFGGLLLGRAVGDHAISLHMHGTLSVIFLMFQYFGPGMIKSVLTLRTGNAWVHLWAYHAIAPHVTVDTPNIVNVFKLG